LPTACDHSEGSPALSRTRGRRLNFSLNTVKRYDRASEPERLQRVPKYRAPLSSTPHRDYPRKRRAEEPGAQVQQLLRAIRELGCRVSSNLVRYINQGRLDAGRQHLSPCRAARILLTRPHRLTADQQETRAELTAACPEVMASLTAPLGLEP
jgi:hypothetical protein